MWRAYYKANGPRKPANWSRTVRSSTQQEKIFSFLLLLHSWRWFKQDFSHTACTRTCVQLHLQLSRGMSDLRCCHTSWKILSFCGLSYQSGGGKKKSWTLFTNTGSSLEVAWGREQGILCSPKLLRPSLACLLQKKDGFGLGEGQYLSHFCFLFVWENLHVDGLPCLHLPICWCNCFF